jgi:thiamine kinase-like enzyme
MAMVCTDVNLFPFIQPTHPFHAHLERFQVLLNADPSYAEQMHMLNDGGSLHVHALMRARLRPDRGWELKGIHTSFQVRDASRRHPFRALTLYYAPGASEIDHWVFPRDPYLPGLASFFGAPRGGTDPAGDGDVVLAYVPRLRLTFRTQVAGGAPAIGKVVHPEEAADIYGRLVKVSAAVNDSSRTFSVAAPLGIDTTEGVFFQELRPGTELTHLLDQDNCRDLLGAIGRIHRDVHCLDVPDLPAWNFRKFLQRLVTYVEWISFLRPEQRPLLEDVRDLLLRHVPDLTSADYTFCHGDFSCRQILDDHGCWSVVDFDGCLRGDPHFEVAKLIASLKYNAPLFHDLYRDPTEQAPGLLEEAYEAYIQGYEDQAQRTMNRCRILWYRIAWEIHHLARRFKRDQFHPVAFERAVALIRELSAQLRTG